MASSLNSSVNCTLSFTDLSHLFIVDQNSLDKRSVFRGQGHDSQKFVETILTAVTEKEIVGAFRPTLEKAVGEYLSPRLT